MLDDEDAFEKDKSVPATTHESGSAAWASVFGFIAVLTFIFGLIYLAHNHWHF